MEVITRATARSQGLKRYFTGKPCKHGHLDSRLVSNGACNVCTAIRLHKIYHADLEASRLKAREAGGKISKGPELLYNDGITEIKKNAAR